jgi:signal transduction histidine kinase
MPDIGWGIIIESPYSVRQTFVKRARDQSLMLIVACILLIFLLALFYILSINRNFRQLIKAIKAMAEGNYARRIRLITNSITPMEIVLLTGEFNRMARRMAEAWRNSQELNQELVKRNEQ